MQSVNAALQTELDKGQGEPRTLLDLYELYAHDYVPGDDGPDPADAIETFAAQEITWNGIAYLRKITGRSDIVKSITEKTNSVTLNFSNIDRYMATLAQTTDMEGLLLVVRCVSPDVEDDSLVLYTGKLEKPSDIDKGIFSIAAKQDFGNINVTVPPRKFTTEDPEGRIPSDPLYEGINLIAITGSLTFPQVVPSTSFFGRLLGRRKTISVTQQWSATDNTPFGQVRPVVFGRCQMQSIIFAWADKGSHVGFLGAFCDGPIAGIDQLKTRTNGISDPVCNFANPPAPAVKHLGDPGGTGTNTGNTCQADLGSGMFFSRLAYVEGAFIGWQNGQIVPLGLDVADEPAVLTAIIRGLKIPVPDSSGDFSSEAWTNNPAYIARFILTDPMWCNIDAAFMDDAAIWRTGQHCDEPILDKTNTQVIVVPAPDLDFAGVSFTRYQASGLYTPRRFLYEELGDTSIVPESVDGPYVGRESGDPIPDPSDPTDPTFISQYPLIKRYTANFPVTEEIRVVDLLHKVLFPAFKGYMRVDKRGKYQVLSEQPSDSTRLRTAISVGATSIPVLNILPWKTGPELLKGRINLGLHLINSEVRTPSAAVYSTSGNSVTLTSSGSGITATASGASLSGGSTSAPATGTVTISGTPNAGDTITVTINGIAVVYTLSAEDTTSTAAAMVAQRINADPRLNKFILASWDSGTPTVVTITCLHGALTVPALLKAHSIGIADPTTAPTVAAAGSGALAAGVYKVAYADVTAAGSTALTALASVTLTANQKINLSSLPALVGTSRDFYVSEKANSTNLRFIENRTNNSNFSINSLPLPGATIPPSSNTTAEELIRVAMAFATNSQDIFKPWRPSQTLAIQGNAQDDTYLPTVLNGHKYTLTTAGTTGTSEPTWPTTAGATVTSGSAVFTESGSTVLQQAGLTRANIKKDTFRWPLGSRQSSVNQIKGNFRDPKQDYALVPFTVNDRAHQAQVKKIFPLEVDLSAVDNENQMARLANGVLSKNREGDHFHSFTASPAAMVLEEGDVICASDDSGGLINVATRIEELRINKDHEVTITQARRYSTRMYSDDAGAHRIPLASTLKFVATKDTVFELIDNFPTRDQDALIPGWYVVASHDLNETGDWRGAKIIVDYGDGDVVLIDVDVPALMGQADTVLAAVSDVTVLDRTNSFTFTLLYDDNSLASVTEAELMSNVRRNLFVVGNEYVQAATITALGNRQYTASVLLRGRFGADNWQLTHSSDERVILLNGAEKFLPIDVARLNVEFDYQAVTTNQDFADGTTGSFTWTGGTVKPYSPVNLRGARNTAGDLLMRWTRRDRTALGLKDLAGTPMAEEKPVFVLEVYDGSTLKRTVRNPQLAVVDQPGIIPIYDPGNRITFLS